MSAKNAFILVFLSIFIGWFILPREAGAVTTASERIAVSLIIDTSGSMAETDPNHLRGEWMEFRNCLVICGHSFNSWFSSSLLGG